MDITLALGGGGTRGTAHIGVLRTLTDAGFRIRAVAGTSIGSIVAALFASGKSPDQIKAIFASVDQTKLYGWPLSDGPGLLGVRGISEFLTNHLGESTFKSLKIPCAIVAVDLNSNREIILRSGLVVDAIMGSIAVPGLFPPKELDGYCLIDGGTLDPVPVRAARELAPGLPVIAVSLMQPLDAPATKWDSLATSLNNPFSRQFSRMRITQTFRIFADSVDIASRQMAEMRLQIDLPEVIIRPDVQEIDLLDRVDVDEISERGAKAAITKLPDIRRAVSFSARLSRRAKQLFRSGRKPE